MEFQKLEKLTSKIQIGRKNRKIFGEQSSANISHLRDGREREGKGKEKDREMVRRKGEKRMSNTLVPNLLLQVPSEQTRG